MQKREFTIEPAELDALIKKVAEYYGSESAALVPPEVHGFSTKGVKIISVHEYGGWNLTGPLTLIWFFEELDGYESKLTLLCMGGKNFLGVSFGRPSASINRVIKTLIKSGFSLTPIESGE